MAEKLLQLGATPLTFSDSSGFIYEPEVRNDTEGRLPIALRKECAQPFSRRTVGFNALIAG